MSCSKRKYNSETLAVEALLEARINFDSNSATTVYLCGDCGYWHLTSRGDMHPKLKAALDSGQIARLKLSNYWERKLR